MNAWDRRKLGIRQKAPPDEKFHAKAKHRSQMTIGMSKFAVRTGLSPAALRPQRYLWTDAFAVCNFFELSARTGDQTNRRCAVDLIDQVHEVLGRYRNDDMRSDWISGLDDEAG